MYAHIEGLVAEKSADGLVLDCGGVGYLLSVSRNTLAAAPARQPRRWPGWRIRLRPWTSWCAWR